MSIRSFAAFGLVLVLATSLMGCSSTPKKVIVKKGSCQEVFGGALLECEVVEK